MEEFFKARIEIYGKRKNHQLRVLKKEIGVLNNKARFIEELNAGKLKIQGVPKQDLIKLLQERGFAT